MRTWGVLVSLKYYFTNKEDLRCRIIAASEPLNHISFVLKVFPELKCPIFTMSVVAMGRTFVLMSPGPSARLNLDFDRTTQCLNLVQSTLFIPKKTIDAETWVLAQLVRSEAGCLAHHGMRHTCPPHTLSPAIFAHYPYPCIISFQRTLLFVTWAGHTIKSWVLINDHGGREHVLGPGC